MQTPYLSDTATTPITLSVVIPTHGRVDLFEITLESLRAQTFADFEIIVTDDSPNWEDRRQIQEATLTFGHETRRPARYLFSQAKLGQARNTNQGLRAATGRFVRILHSDDLLAPRALETEMSLLNDKRLNLDMLYHLVEAFTDQPRFDRTPVLQLVQPSLFFRSEMHSGTPLPSATVFRRELLDEVGCMREDFDFLCDWEFVARLIVTQHRRNRYIARLTPGFVAWRVHANSTTGKLWHRHFLEHEQFMNELRADLPLSEAMIGDRGTRDGFFATAVRYRYRRLEQDVRRMETVQLLKALPTILRCALSKGSLRERLTPAPWEPKGAAKYPALVVDCDVPRAPAPPAPPSFNDPRQGFLHLMSVYASKTIIEMSKAYAARILPAAATAEGAATTAALPAEKRTDLHLVPAAAAPAAEHENGQALAALVTDADDEGVDITLETSAVARLLEQPPLAVQALAAIDGVAESEGEEDPIAGPKVLTVGDEVEIHHALMRPVQKAGVVRVLTEYNNSANFWAVRELLSSATHVRLCEINLNHFVEVMLHQALKYVGVGTQVEVVLHDNQHLTSFGYKALLDRQSPGQFAWVSQEKRGPLQTQMIYERRKPAHRTYSAPHTGWTFGMLTTGQRLQNVEQFIDSIEAHCHEPYEILIVSPVDLGTLADRPHVRVLNFTEHDDLGWITRKKNLICREATFSDILICHDRFVIDSDFARDFRGFGYAYGLAAVRVRLADGRRGLDWAVVSSQNQVWSNGGLLDYRAYSQYAYNPGGATIIRKAFWRDFPWNENLFWNEHEDVELCRRIQRAGGVIALTTASVVAAEDRWVDHNPRIPYCDQNEVLFGRAVGEQRIRFISKEQAA